jgi:hypothetical protein
MLQIRTTGVEDFLDGSHNIKVLIIGGPGVGKTRHASYWPKPFYADCESGRASVADRGVAYVEIHDSRDMLDFLSYCKKLEAVPKAERQYQTIVIDTIDGFMRSVKDEWLDKTKSGEFRGYDAWGYLDTKMNMLMSRLLNLDYNVIVNVHYKTTTVKDKAGDETIEYELQLSGSLRQTIFNDFDLVGLMDSFYEAEDGQRVLRRGLTFTPTPKWPMLKDRLDVTPQWMPIDFADSDYGQLLDAVTSRMTADAMPVSSVVGEVPPESDEIPAGVRPPTSGGPVEPQSPKEMPLESMSKQELLAKAAEMGVQVRGNLLKAEIITAIKGHEVVPIAAEPVEAVEETPVQEEHVTEPEPVEPDEVEPDEPEVAEPDESEEEEEPEEEEVIPEPTVATPDPAADPETVCADCSKSLADEKPDFVKLSYIKFRRRLCEACYQKAKANK